MPWDTLPLSVMLYIVAPVIVTAILRRPILASGGQAALRACLARLGRVSFHALMLLFGFQCRQILQQPIVVALLAVPILVQV